MANVARPFGGGVFIADTSAWARAERSSTLDGFGAALRGGQIATCAIVSLEFLHSARNGDEFDDRMSLLAQLRDVPISRSVTTAALRAYRDLAHRQPLFHRSVKLPDVLVAAAAADAAIGVLHYDADFDTLAEVLPFESHWIAPRGSLD